jgi:hypothetical protein
MADEQKIREFLNQAKEKSDIILSQDHYGAEVKTVILDLLQICQNFENLLSSNVGANADARLLKKRLDQAKHEHKITMDELSQVETLLLSLVGEVKLIGGEVNNLIKALPADEANPLQISAHKIRSANIKIAEAIAQAQKKK